MASNAIQDKINGTGLIDGDVDMGGLGGSKLLKSSMLQSQDVRERMEHVRSFRKKRSATGGSMITLGGSFV